MRLKLITVAAAIAAATSAQAGDLYTPAAAPAVDYVKICDAYGTGFWYIPGTETCLKIGGYVFGEWWVGDSDHIGNRDYVGSLSWDERDRSGTFSRVRASLVFDARTNTEYGLLRSVIETWYEVATPTGTGGPFGNISASTNLRLWQGFIQFGGLVAGRTSSFYDFWTGYTISPNWTGDYSIDKVNLLAYQFAFGNGVTAAISVEDPTTSNPYARRRDGAGFFRAGDAVIVASNPYGGLRLPDLVGNIRVDQAWGAAQIMGALRQDIPRFGDKELGFAVGGGIEINLPMIGQGDKFAVQASYCEGAINYCHATIGRQSGATPYLNGELAGDYFTLLNGELRQTTAWAVGAGFRHFFTPKLQFNVQGGFASVDGFEDRDLTQVDIMGALVYTIVPGFTVGFEVDWRSVDLENSLKRRLDLNDADAIQGALRFTRAF